MLRGHLWEQLSSVDLLNMSHVPSEMDLIMSGGGFLGYYLVGVDRVLRKLCREEKLRVERYAGTSVGALASVAMVCGLGDHMIELYDQLQGTPDFFPKIREYFMKMLPENAYQQCSGRVHIVISTLSWKYQVLPRLEPMVVSHFRDNCDLVEACMASCSVPYFVSSQLFYPFRGKWCMDGFFTQNVPLLPPRPPRPQMVVRLHRVPYSWWTVFTPYEHMVLPLIVQGALETELFFHRPYGGGHVGALEWYDEKPLKKRRALFLFLQKLGLSRVLGVAALVVIVVGAGTFRARGPGLFPLVRPYSSVREGIPSLVVE